MHVGGFTRKHVSCEDLRRHLLRLLLDVLGERLRSSFRVLQVLAQSDVTTLQLGKLLLRLVAALVLLSVLPATKSDDN